MPVRQVQLPFVLILSADAALWSPPGTPKYAEPAHAMRPALQRHNLEVVPNVRPAVHPKYGRQFRIFPMMVDSRAPPLTSS
jgi:hypothetical protein